MRLMNPKMRSLRWQYSASGGVRITLIRTNSCTEGARMVYRPTPPEAAMMWEAPSRCAALAPTYDWIRARQLQAPRAEQPQTGMHPCQRQACLRLRRIQRPTHLRTCTKRRSVRKRIFHPPTSKLRKRGQRRSALATSIPPRAGLTAPRPSTSIVHLQAWYVRPRSPPLRRSTSARKSSLPLTSHPAIAQIHACSVGCACLSAGPHEPNLTARSAALRSQRSRVRTARTSCVIAVALVERFAARVEALNHLRALFLLELMPLDACLQLTCDGFARVVVLLLRHGPSAEQLSIVTKKGGGRGHVHGPQIRHGRACARYYRMRPQR